MNKKKKIVVGILPIRSARVVSKSQTCLLYRPSLRQCPNRYDFVRVGTYPTKEYRYFMTNIKLQLLFTGASVLETKD